MFFVVLMRQEVILLIQPIDFGEVMQRSENRIREQKQLEWELKCKKQSDPNQ